MWERLRYYCRWAARSLKFKCVMVLARFCNGVPAAFCRVRMLNPASAVRGWGWMRGSKDPKTERSRGLRRSSVSA